MRACILLVSAFLLSSTALAADNKSRCYLRFSDNNRNGEGSVEGSCRIEVKHTARPGQRPNFSMDIFGFEYGESRSIGRAGLRWDDQNRDGKGTVVGNIRVSVDRWSSCRVGVYLRVAGKTYTVATGNLSYCTNAR